MSVALESRPVASATRPAATPLPVRPREAASPEEVFRLARALLGERRTAEAMGMLRPALERFPREPALRYLAALGFARLGDEMNAGLVLGEALKLAPGQPVLLLRRALFMLGHGDPEQAKALLWRLASDRQPEIRAEAARVLHLVEETGLGQARHLPVLDLDPSAEATLLGSAFAAMAAVVRPEAAAAALPHPPVADGIGIVALLAAAAGILAWTGHPLLGIGCAVLAGWVALKKS